MFQLRKLVHIGGALFVPVALFSPYLAVGLAILGIIAFALLELIKLKLDPATMRLLYRKGEMGGFAVEPMAYLVSIASLLSVSLFFMPKVCYVAILTLTIGDGLATIAGKYLGGPRLPRCEKTWSGTLSGFAASAAAGFLVAGPVAIVGAAGGMIAEAYVGRSDNFAISIAAFLCAVAATSLLV